MNSQNTRRAFIQASATVGAGLALSACGGGKETQSGKQTGEYLSKSDEREKGGEVTATEDLMREHGILRRALLVYSAMAKKLRANTASVPPDAIQKTAKLFRAFGEDYHEKKLEEPYIFPAVKKAGGPAASYPDILVVQHDRGREIYEHHAAREDTIIFPAWKKALPDKEYDEMGEKFEEIEHQQFGEDGFDTAVKQISEIEGELGLADIAQFTAPPPPKA